MPKSVLITGCSSGGIGYALAQAFASRGLTVFATARITSKMAGLDNVSNVHLLPLDVTDPSSIAAAVEMVKTATGKLDYLVNNSGRGYWMPALDSDIEEGKQVFDVNFWGVLRTTQAFAYLLVASKGTVVNIGSINGYLNVPYSGIYSASKSAGHVLGEILRVELAPFSVKVLTVVTGSIATALHDKMPPAAIPSESMYSPLKQKLHDVALAKDNIVRQKPESYAEAVVADVLAGKNGKVWHGNNSWKVKVGHILLPTSVQDHILTADSDLDKLGK